MTTSNPAAALSGARTGHICDLCNRGVRTGDLVRAYATRYDPNDWDLRRLWCEDCSDSAIDPGTEGADEVLVEAVFWAHRLVSIAVIDRSLESDGKEV